VSGWAWRATVHHVVGFPVALVGFILTVTFGALTAGLAITAILGLGMLVLLLGSVRMCSAVQRSRFRNTLGVDIVPPPRNFEGSWLRRLLAEARAGSTWRQMAYHLLAFLITTFSFCLVTITWSVGLGAAAVLAYSPALPSDGILGLDMRAPATLATVTVSGIALLLIAPWLARGLANLDVAAACSLLGSSRVETLTRRVEGVVDAADAERRRIERDLHDGAQQRLVSLAMNLGMARAKLVDAPEPARQAIEDAHEEAKRALSELRGFIRGLHPAVLDDRGLDAALSGIAARAPLPVTVRVNVAGRCSPTVEAVAYFVVSEALTNVAKHAHASHAEVAVDRVGGRLRVVVADDGHGGASAERGTGLRGLAQRTASVDGTLRIDSPTGGPTIIVAELPCEP
jgi:signal transduction histidine kinase